MVLQTSIIQKSPVQSLDGIHDGHVSDGFLVAAEYYKLNKTGKDLSKKITTEICQSYCTFPEIQEVYLSVSLPKLKKSLEKENHLRNSLKIKDDVTDKMLCWHSLP